MLVRISAAARQDDALLDLYRWLRQDEDVKRVARVSPGSAEPGSGAMGAVEYINVVCSVLGVVISAYAAWRSARPSAPPVHLTVNATTVVLKDASAEALRAAVARLQEGAGEAEPVQRRADDG
ncbi:hypothetical protein VT50_0202740 [Streptomyces antioxidans]|uniref:Uncharacterized protein n=1 Tax=Streptomyces antioxidans TaxID=1507734 RepID=A0A1V4DC51_9ACTN|nr:hypothetical protein [Streptomyces antioxidans]OPF83920.1 hypothetical protein VT50_0202740 [Streptomyces antioxidans]